MIWAILGLWTHTRAALFADKTIGSSLSLVSTEQEAMTIGAPRSTRSALWWYDRGVVGLLILCAMAAVVGFSDLVTAASIMVLAGGYWFFTGANKEKKLTVSETPYWTALTNRPHGEDLLGDYYRYATFACQADKKVRIHYCRYFPHSEDHGKTTTHWKLWTLDSKEFSEEEFSEALELTEAWKERAASDEAQAHQEFIEKQLEAEQKLLDEKVQKDSLEHMTKLLNS